MHSVLTSCRDGAVRLIRPFLDIAKSRLIATLKAASIPFANDPTNRDPRFTRARLRGLMPVLAGEGLDVPRLATLARRLARAEQRTLNFYIERLLEAHVEARKKKAKRR